MLTQQFATIRNTASRIAMVIDSMSTSVQEKHRASGVHASNSVPTVFTTALSRRSRTLQRTLTLINQRRGPPRTY